LRRRLLTLASLGLLASLAYPPTAAADRPHRGGSMLGAPIVGVHPSAAPAIAPSFRPSFPRSRVPGFRRFAKHGVPIVYVTAPALYEPLVYAEPPPAPPAETSAPVAPPPPPERDVIQYSDGRYELRGDGVATPYRWVWIPNPPPPPRSGRDGRLYGWIDERGELHVTDRWDAVPERHRAEAKRNQSS
jgi:hypothetical protein